MKEPMKHRSQQYWQSGINCHLSPLVLTLLTTCASSHAWADNYFNPAFLSGDPAAVADLTRYEKGDGQAPGTYRVDVYLNNQFVVTRDVTFKEMTTNTDNKTSQQILAHAQSASSGGPTKASEAAIAPAAVTTVLQACLTHKDLDSLGVNLTAFPALDKLPPPTCIGISTIIPDAKTTFNFETQRLDISIPQAALRNDARGYIPPEQWDQGINALLLNYNFTGSNSIDRTDGNHSAQNNYFLGLNGGANLGAWRLRDYSTWNYNSGSTSDWQHVSTYLQRTVIPLRGELTVGDSYTPSEVFDSLSFRGVQLASDDNMLPDSLKGFAPTIRGIAKSNAKVTIQQNGYTIYQSYVPPGAFVIDDLYPTSSSGDLQVTLTEADGSQTSYAVPYSAVPILQREGHIKYAVTAAQYRSPNDYQSKVDFAQSTLIWGLPRGFTAYGGIQLSNAYHALAIGVGLNMGDYGAISADVTDASSTLADESQHKGQSFRFLYAKSLNELGTNFQLLGYRYSTTGFYTLDETTYKSMDGYNNVPDNRDNNPKNTTPIWMSYYNLDYSKRGKIQVNITQQLGTLGSIFITGSQQTYWHTDKTDSLYQMGYSGTWNGISYAISYNYNKSASQPGADKIFAFNISIPISQWLSPVSTDMTQSHNSAYATYSTNTDTRGNTTQSGGVNGTLLSDNNLSYSLQQGYGSHDVGDSGNVSLSYQGAYGNSNVGYNYSSNGDYQQVNYGLSGGVVAHANGLTLSQPLGDTNVLIAVPGASDVAIENGKGVKTDWRGYAIVPYATTYRQNRIALDTNSMKNNVDIDDSVVSVVPTQGALVRALFTARVGVRALITLLHNLKAVPFGATVSTQAGNASIVGDDGQVYLSGLPLKGNLKVQWGNDISQQCNAQYSLPVLAQEQAITKVKVKCQ